MKRFPVALAGYPSPMNAPNPETAAPERSERADVQSDPAKGADGRADWTDEGGATAEGAATDD